jgi:hypothetical protein
MFWLVLFALFISTTALAAVPQTLHFSGKLDTAGGVFTGTIEVTFGLYADANAASSFWSDKQAVMVTNGRFHVELGPFGAGDVDVAALHVGVTVGTDNEMDKVAISSVPYALRASEAGNAATVGGQAATAFADATHSHALADLEHPGCTSGQVLTSNGSGWTCGSVAGLTETDPQVGSNTSNTLAKWDGTALVSGSIFDNGRVGIGTTSPSAFFHVVGPVAETGSSISLSSVGSSVGSFEYTFAAQSHRNAIQISGGPGTIYLPPKKGWTFGATAVLQIRVNGVWTTVKSTSVVTTSSTTPGIATMVSGGDVLSFTEGEIDGIRGNGFSGMTSGSWKGWNTVSFVPRYVPPTNTKFSNGEVIVEGDLSVTGSKNFRHAHPTDADKVLVYVSLEGGEAGTYWRGTAQLKDGRAVVALPSHFGLVTSPSGLTVQLTPLGNSPGLWVGEKTPDRFVVHERDGGSGSVRFDYFVQGVRQGFESHRVIRARR